MSNRFWRLGISIALAIHIYSLYMYMIVAVLVLMPVIYIVYTTPPVMGVLIGIIALKLSMGLLCWSGSCDS